MPATPNFMTDVTSPPELAPDYYLSNFRFLVDWVWARYRDLLTEEEQTFVETFYGLGRDAQCLLVRLCSRKGPLFRQDKLNYSEIVDLDGAAQELVVSGLAHADIPIGLSVLANALTKNELVTLFGDEIGALKKARKDELVEHLSAQFSETKPWAVWTADQLGNALYLDNQAIINNLLLLFFGNVYQDLTEFVLQDLGLYRYENYPIDPRHRVFNSRNELDQYWHLVQLREQLEIDNSLPNLQRLTTEISTHLQGDCASEKIRRRRARLINQIAYDLERAGEHLLALELYEQSHLPPARERRVRLLEKQGNYQAAWALLNELISQPQTEEELQVAHRMAPRLAKKLFINFTKVTRGKLNEQHLVLNPLMHEDGYPLRVEEVVRLSVDHETTPCIYTENALLCGLFGLWLWPEMFRGIEGAFANPFQAAPLDIHQENFAANRPGIAELWKLIESDTHHAPMLKTWDEKFGVANYFVSWSFLRRELVELALACIPARDLKIIFERMLFDIKSNRSGLPDLIQFYPAQKNYRMIEVKGPGDRIQDNQQRWLDYFLKHQIPAEVWYVRWE